MHKLNNNFSHYVVETQHGDFLLFVCSLRKGKILALISKIRSLESEFRTREVVKKFVFVFHLPQIKTHSVKV